mgnify:CR=1 FL=1
MFDHHHRSNDDDADDDNDSFINNVTLGFSLFSLFSRIKFLTSFKKNL